MNITMMTEQCAHIIVFVDYCHCYATILNLVKHLYGFFLFIYSVVRNTSCKNLLTYFIIKI